MTLQHRHVREIDRTVVGLAGLGFISFLNTSETRTIDQYEIRNKAIVRSVVQVL
jgi:hypothetical protein